MSSSGGLQPVAGPECGACKAVIVGQIVEALGKTYHPEHFVCNHCSQPFPGGRYFVGLDEMLYCEQDYKDLQAKRCEVCKDVINGKSITAQGLTFHSEHFFCSTCGTNLVQKKYKIDAINKIYCSTCGGADQHIIRPEAHLCARCNQAIVGPYLLIKGQFVHPRHYRCQECGVEFKGGDCHEFEGDFYCKPHYDILLLKKCARCGKPCKGRSILALDKVWHPEHFSCHICNTVFNESQYWENDGKPYCQVHYNELFGDTCEVCKEPILEGAKKFLDKAYHEHHFQCSTCRSALKDGDFTAWDAKPMCRKCYGKLPEELRKRVEMRLKEEQKAKVQRLKNDGEAAH